MGGISGTARDRGMYVADYVAAAQCVGAGL